MDYGSAGAVVGGRSARQVVWEACFDRLRRWTRPESNEEREGGNAGYRITLHGIGDLLRSLLVSHQGLYFFE